MGINFFFEDINEFSLSKQDDINWITDCINEHSKKTGDLNFIFCSDNYLLEINKEYLNHNYFTDIITFDYCMGDIISGDIYISTDRVEENAKEFKVSFSNELHRVIIHGVLHLLGLKDGSEEEKSQMRSAENECLSNYKFKKL